MNKPKNTAKINITPTKKTMIKIYNLKIEDLQKQLEKLKKHKNKYDYKYYRYFYMRLYNTIADTKRALKKIQ